ncbi:hypothetical protein FACS1894187_13340 [Synergistales bacterium]|nr:hypothetical protein FACS1894187_13340 [Synergistales bacterium]
MSINGVGNFAASANVIRDFDEIYKLRKKNSIIEEQREAALEKVNEAFEATAEATKKMMDTHNEMVKKSQEMRKARDRKEAIERMSRERQDEHTELLARIAITNAERRDILEATRARKIAQEDLLKAS